MDGRHQSRVLRELGPVSLQQMAGRGVEGRIRIRVDKEARDGLFAMLAFHCADTNTSTYNENVPEGQLRIPVALQCVQTHAARGLFDVGMPYLGTKISLWRTLGICRGHL